MFSSLFSQAVSKSLSRLGATCLMSSFTAGEKITGLKLIQMKRNEEKVWG